MQLIPAIDIRDGRCVRLLKGEFDKVTRYDYDPCELAAGYGRLGARWLHIVDLDGAQSGRPVNGRLIREIAAAGGMQIQIGGGIRTPEDLARTLEFADRAVIGSLAVTGVETVRALLGEHGADRIALGLDIRFLDGEPRVTTHGWTEASRLTLAAAIEQYRNQDLRHVLCTDVDRDGALTGPNVDLYSECVRQWPEIEFQASGGIRSAKDLAQLSRTGVAGAISGKALLDRLISPEELQPFLPNG